MNEMELFQQMLKPYRKCTDVVGEQDKPNVYNSVNLPRKIDYSFLHNDVFNLLTQFETDQYSVSKKLESLCYANEFLEKYNWNLLSGEHSKTGQLFIKHVLLNFSDEEMYDLKKKIDKIDIRNIQCEKEIKYNTINHITKFLIEDPNPNKKYEYLMFRKIKADGNCYYRIIMFAFLENIIFQKNIIFIKNFIVDFKMKLKNPILISMAKENKIDLNQTFKCLIMIYFSLTSKSRDPILKSYSVLLKMYNNIDDFDKGLIIYFRILIYLYINENRTKTLLEDFPIFIGNLLPTEFIDENGHHDYDSFFKYYLFNFNQISERIDIYLTPFILGYDIEILYINNVTEIDTSECKKSILNAGNFNDPDNKITILYKKTHYELVYTNDYIKKYNKYLLIDFPQEIENVSCCFICKDNNKSMLARFKKLGKNEIFICYKCILKDINYYMKNLFLYFIQKQKRFYLSLNNEEINNFLEDDIMLGNCIDINIEDAINKVHKIYKTFTFQSVMKKIKSLICIYCNKDINEKSKSKLVLPCNCCLCCKKCINDFYNFIIRSLPFKENMICFCGHIYDFSYVNSFVKKYNNYLINCEELLKYYIDKSSNKCFNCLNIFENVIKCEVINNNFTINKKIIHFFCKDCLTKIKKDTLFKCTFCSVEHQFKLIIK
jgi:hypothetical protein